MRILHLLLSRTARQAVDLCKHVRKLANAQRDLLNEQALQKISGAIQDVQQAVDSRADRKSLCEQMRRLEEVATKWIRPYPRAAIRENVEVALVAAAVAISIHTFFFKPFKIPTGSMQPTLYGITAENLRDQPDVRIPNRLRRFFDYWFSGVSYYHVVARSDGALEAYQPPRLVLPFVYRQRFKVGDEWYTVWSAWERLLQQAGVEPMRLYRRGEDILKAKVVAGDHLFVDRVTYNFRRPKRGEIIVFKTAGITDPLSGLPAMPQDQFYVKRLVALAGEHVRIGNDRRLIINGASLEQQTPHFENVYAFNPRDPPRPGRYSGHVNGRIAAEFTGANIAPLFPDENSVFVVRSNHYLVMGDNTMDSSDGRVWGDFSRTNIIGKHCFVYWPFNDRFGWAVR